MIRLLSNKFVQQTKLLDVFKNNTIFGQGTAKANSTVKAQIATLSLPFGLYYGLCINERPSCLDPDRSVQFTNTLKKEYCLHIETEKCLWQIKIIKSIRTLEIVYKMKSETIPERWASTLTPVNNCMASLQHSVKNHKGP